MLKDQRQRLLTLLDSFETNTPDPSEDSDNESSISGDSDNEFSIDAVLGDLQIFVECLVSLGFSLQRPACDPAPCLSKAAGPPPSVTGSAADMRLIKMPSAENLSSALCPEPMDDFSEETPSWAEADDWLLFEQPLLVMADDGYTPSHLEVDTIASSGLNDNMPTATLNPQLNPMIPSKAMSQLGDQDLHLPFRSKKVGRHNANLERHEQTSTLALQADQK